MPRYSRGRPKGSKSFFPNDSQRKRVYSAEEIPGCRDELLEKEEVELFVRSVATKAWFRKRYPRITKVQVRYSNSERRCAEGRMFINTAILVLPRWAWTKQIILHELAHCCTSPVLKGEKNARAAHGREWVGTYLFLVKKLLGDEKCDMLKRQFRNHKVDWDSRYAS